MDQAETLQVPLTAAVVVLDGEFDVADRERLADAFGVATCDPVVIVDLSRTEYMDSTVLSELVKLQKSMAKRAGRLLVTQPTGNVARLFDVAQVGVLFGMCASAEQSLAELELQRDAYKRITLVGKRFAKPPERELPVPMRLRAFRDRL